MKDSNIVKKEESSPSDMIRSAIENKIDLDKLEKLLLLQERYEQNQARKAYHKAMAEFKVVPLNIVKDKKVGYTTGKGKVGYSHASLANVVNTITEQLSKHELSVSWKTQQNGTIIVTCCITHSKGHSEKTTLSANADTSGSKNEIQALGSTITYLERYTLLAALGLATADTDDDGQGSSVEKIDEGKLKILTDLIKEKGTEEKKFLAYMKVEKLEDISMPDFAKAKIALESRKTKGKTHGNS